MSPKCYQRGCDGPSAYSPSLRFGHLCEEQGVTQTAAVDRSTRLLVVDDDPNIADAMALLLRCQGHEVTVAYSGAEALERVEREDPQVVFLDIGMAGMDGFETARRLRAADPVPRRRRLVAVSGYGDEAFLAACRQAGFDHQLVKPVNRQMLDAALAAFP
jgi:CheY-like chemotaxis protein